MGAAESTSRTNGTNQEEEERKQKSSTVVGAAATIAAVGVAAWGISRMLSENTDTQENESAMKMKMKTEPSYVVHQMSRTSVKKTELSYVPEGKSQTSDKKTWSPPPRDRFKLNTDATCHPDDEDYNNTYMDLDGDSVKRGPAACGGILRDHNGKWIRGFVGYIGVTDNFTAELHGIHKGLELLAERQYKGAILETDCEPAYLWVNQPDKKCSKSPIVINSWDIIEKCRQLIEENNIKMNHVLEDANKCADKLADIALEHKLKYKVIEDLPNEVSRFVSQDAK